MTTSIDDILSEKPPETPNAEPVITETPVDHSAEYQSRKQAQQEKEWTAQGRDPKTGQFLPKDEAKVEEVKAEPKEPKPEAKPEIKPEQEFTEKEKGIYAGLQEERRKRQELEQQIRELREAQTKAQQPQPEKKSFYDDPDGALAAQEQKFQMGMLQAKAQTSEMIARSQHQDYDQVFEVFKGVVQSTPGLLERMFADPHPAEFAYRIGKNYKSIQEAGSIDNLKAQVEKEVRLKLEQEYKDKEAQLLKERAAIPGTLTDARGGVQTKPVWTGPTPMDSIIGR